MAYRLDEGNVRPYVAQTYGSIILEEKKCIPNIQSYLQSDYAGEMDCSLVSLMTCCRYFNPDITDRVYYDYIKQVAKKYFYTDNIGTQAPFINNIGKKVFAMFGIKKKIKSGYFKNLGWNKKHIICNINEGKPVILSL